MENNEIKISLSAEAEKKLLISVKSQLMKLLSVIEKEENGEGEASLFFDAFMIELVADNDLCNQKLIQVVSKIHCLYNKDAYKQMEHSQIRRYIFDARGIIDHLLQK